MQTPEFATHLDALVLAAATVPTAVMCAEALPSRCHRALLADALLARGSRGAPHPRSGAGRDSHADRRTRAYLDGRLSYPGEPELFQTG